MTDYTITLNNHQDAGVTAARLQYNSEHPDVFDGETLITENTFNNNSDYIQFIIEQAANSYATQFKVGIITSAAFLFRIPGPKYAAMLIASETDQILAGLISSINQASEIRLFLQQTIDGASYLVAMGYLTQEETNALIAY